MKGLVVGAVAIAASLYLAYGYFMQQRGAPQIGTEMVRISVPKLNDVERSGEAVFNKNCASCHGKNAVGQQGVAPPLVHKIYEPGHHGDISFELAAKQGVRQHHWSFGSMPPVPGLTKRQTSDIIAYVRKLQRANGIN